MKTPCSAILARLAAVSASAAPSPGFVVAERGPNHQVWTQVNRTTNSSGHAVADEMQDGRAERSSVEGERLLRFRRVKLVTRIGKQRSHGRDDEGLRAVSLHRRMELRAAAR